MQSGTKGQMK